MNKFGRGRCVVGFDLMTNRLTAAASVERRDLEIISVFSEFDPDDATLARKFRDWLRELNGYEILKTIFRPFDIFLLKKKTNIIYDKKHLWPAGVLFYSFHKYFLFFNLLKQEVELS